MEIEEINISSLRIKDERKRTHSETLSLDLDINCNNNEDNQLRRSRRKRIRPLQVQNRSISLRSRQLNANSSQNDIKKYYLDKRVQLLSLSLETIFEEPKDEKIMSGRKLKRCIHFSEVLTEKPDKSKIKKRCLKAKKLIKGGLKKICKKISQDELLNKLKELDKFEELSSD